MDWLKSTKLLACGVALGLTFVAAILGHVDSSAFAAVFIGVPTAYVGAKVGEYKYKKEGK